MGLNKRLHLIFQPLNGPFINDVSLTKKEFYEIYRWSDNSDVPISRNGEYFLTREQVERLGDCGDFELSLSSWINKWKSLKAA